MEASMFLEWVQKNLPSIALGVVNKYNDSKLQPTYLYKTMLRKEYSLDGKWESVTVNNTLVAADLVAMDSPLPLKKRDSIQKSNGDIPKTGMELWLNERQLTELDNLVKINADDEIILAKLFQDVPKVIGGQYEILEYIFLKGLSTGFTVIGDDEKQNVGVRINYGYLDENKFSGEIDDAPFDLFGPLLSKVKSDGNGVTVAMLDQATMNKIRASKQAILLYAQSQNNFSDNPTYKPTFAKLNEVVKDEYGFVFQVVDRTVKFQKNGKDIKLQPWAKNQIVFLPQTDNVGVLAWADLAEKNHPVNGVTYETVDDFILVSKYRQNKPALSEYTNSQARVFPVINNVDQIYIFDASGDAQPVAPQTEGDSTITIFGDATVTRVSLLAAMNGVVNGSAEATMTDAELITAFDALSKKDQAAVKAALGK